MKLYTKVILSVGTAAALSGAGIVLYSQKAVHGVLTAWMEQVAARETVKMSAELGPAIASRDENLLLTALLRVMEGTGGSYAAALDGSGRVVGHSNVAELGRVHADEAARAALVSAQPLAQEIERGGRPVLEVFVPVLMEEGPEEDFLLGASSPGPGKRVGTLRIGMPLEQALATQRRIAGRLTRVVLGLGTVAGLVLLALMRGLLAPIHDLLEGTVKIGAGDYGALVPVTSGDELGELALSFNLMTHELAKTTVSKQFFNDILDNIQDLVIVTDAEGRISLVNPAVGTALGYRADELVGRTWGTVLEGGGVTFTAENRNAAATARTKAGGVIPVLFSAAAMRDAAGRVMGWIGAAKDISDLRKLEARMHQSEKLSAVGQLAAGVAHEINNPLGVILGFAQAMSRQLVADDPQELPVRSIEREALRCKALVQNLLTFARTSQSERSATGVNEAVTQALALVLPQAKMAGVRVTSTLAEGLPLVLGNKNQLEQVIMNLAKNAVDAMPNGGTLALSTELLSGDTHSWVCLRFVDDGTGIPPELLPRIFDPFFTTKPVGQGTGLGLSLVNEIVQKHSGELTVESRPGRTEFLVKLPARTGAELDDRARELREAALRGAATAAKGSISHA